MNHVHILAIRSSLEDQDLEVWVLGQSSSDDWAASSTSIASSVSPEPAICLEYIPADNIIVSISHIVFL
jgi:hypothetical protein